MYSYSTSKSPDPGILCRLDLLECYHRVAHVARNLYLYLHHHPQMRSYYLTLDWSSNARNGKIRRKCTSLYSRTRKVPIASHHWGVSILFPIRIMLSFDENGTHQVKLADHCQRSARIYTWSLDYTLLAERIRKTIC